MQAYVLGFGDVDGSRVADVGGKGAGLGALAKLPGIRVPDGFCVTTAAFAAGMTEAVADAIRARVVPGRAYAVRSSATAEDLPTASFAGQQDSFLGVVGADAVVAHVVRCWDSLHTERARAYRAQQGIDEAQVKMAVVVQEMVEARAAGVLFTADPLSGNRLVTAIEAVAGLGEALVAGHVDPDRYTVRDGEVTGTGVLSTEQARALAALGRAIEAGLGGPQDVEWCLDDAGFAFVQARPITTLFPIPDAGPGNRVYLSVGHQQMMTDAMKPLGLSVWQLFAARTMYEAGSRLFVDATPDLADPAKRNMLINVLGPSDPLTKQALTAIVDRGFIPDAEPLTAPAGPPPAGAGVPDYAAVVDELIAEEEGVLAALAEAIQGRSGTELFDFIQADIKTRRGGVQNPRSFGVIMAGLQATTWLNDQLRAWIGETDAATILSLSAPHNPTSQMGLALMDVADRLRDGADEATALAPFLAAYGMRGVGEIDITRPRWAEAPETLRPLIDANLAAFAPGEAARKFARGEQEAEAKAAEILERVRALPDGEAKAAETAERIRTLRAVIGYREYPKYGIVRRLWLYKQALRAATAHLGPDLDYLRFEELRAAVESGVVDRALIARRQAAFAHHERLMPPRVLTSEGEGLDGAFAHADLPAGALAGLGVSAGVVEGRARVVRSLADARLEPGDILVTRFTDPSWTPAFVAIRGLVTEVGGLMTHGAVVAREYGLPAVVSVAGATTRIRDGQRIRLHGSAGYVELLD